MPSRVYPSWRDDAEGGGAVAFPRCATSHHPTVPLTSMLTSFPHQKMLRVLVDFFAQMGFTAAIPHCTAKYNNIELEAEVAITLVGDFFAASSTSNNLMDMYLYFKRPDIDPHYVLEIRATRRMSECSRVLDRSEHKL